MKKVSIESPYFVKGNPELTEDNRNYFYACAKECLMVYGENPYGSHGFFTHFLDDNIPEERAIGIEAGLQWNIHAEATIVYIDRGISPGMELGIARAKQEGREVEYRMLGVKEYIPPAGEDIISDELLAKLDARIPSFNRDESNARFAKLPESFVVADDWPSPEKIKYFQDDINKNHDFSKMETEQSALSLLTEDQYLYLLTSPQVKRDRRRLNSNSFLLGKDRVAEPFIDRRVGAKEYTEQEWNDFFSKAFHEANIKHGYYPEQPMSEVDLDAYDHSYFQHYKGIR